MTRKALALMNQIDSMASTQARQTLVNFRRLHSVELNYYSRVVRPLLSPLSLPPTPCTRRRGHTQAHSRLPHAVNDETHNSQRINRCRWRISTRSFASFSPSDDRHYDVVIAGGGVAGSSLARLLLDDNFDHRTYRRQRASNRRPIKVALLERRPAPPPFDQFRQQQGQKNPAPNARAYGLSPTSLSLLGPLALQNLVKENRCGIYDSMQVWEHDGPAQLHFVGEDLETAVKENRLVDLKTYLQSRLEGGDGAHRTEQARSGLEDTISRPWLGAVVEDAPLVSALWDELRNDDRIDLLDQVQITDIQSPPPLRTSALNSPLPVKIACRKQTAGPDDEDYAITADLLVAADGANSFVRRTLGSFPMVTHAYGRKAVTCTVQLEPGKDMTRTAFQRFLPFGPIALLPVWNSHIPSVGSSEDINPKYANVVWSTTPAEANYLLSLSSSEFVSKLNHHLCQGPGVNPSLLPTSSGTPHSLPILSTLANEIDSLLRTANTALTMGTWTESPSRNYFRMPPRSLSVVGPILGFDLSLSHVAYSSHGVGGYTAPRVALVADAAHTMHPMAGQGLNLGLKDVDTLARLVKEAIDSGMDVGGTNLFLDQYNQECMLRGIGTVGGVHSLHELFGCSGSAARGIREGEISAESSGGVQNLVGLARSLGMNMVNGLGPVRKTFAELAAGAKPRMIG